MKMYILIKRSIPDKYAPVIAAHSALACYKKYEHDSLTRSSHKRKVSRPYVIKVKDLHILLKTRSELILAFATYCFNIN